MVDLLVLDIDGTIKAPEHRIDQSFFRAVELAQTEGLPLAVCTGRPLAGLAAELAELLGPGQAHAFQGGALIATPSGAQIHADVMQQEGVGQILAQAAERSFVSRNGTGSTRHGSWLPATTLQTFPCSRLPATPWCQPTHEQN